MKNIKVLLADDHKIVLEGIRRILENEPNVEVVAEASDGREALSLVTSLDIDVVFMDISMPNMNGIEAARQILKIKPATKVIILSMHADKRFVERALKAGVGGYLLKNRAVTEVTAALQCVTQGKIYLSPGITNIVVNEFVSSIQKKEKEGDKECLSPREKEVLQLIAEGMTTKEIAGNMNISDKTVDGHRQKIMNKLELHSIAQLTKFAIREGISSLEN
jgi:DNA-binding NarL/FixJ family response regulator